MQACHRGPVPVPAAPLPVQHPVNMPAEAQEDGPSAHVGDAGEAPGFWLQAGPDLAVVGSEPGDERSLSFHLCLFK